VSCTSAVYIGTHVIAHLDARDVARGDRAHPTFLIVVESEDKSKPFRSMSLYEFQQFRETGKAYSLLMSKPSGRIDGNYDAYLSYRVLEDQGSVQVIEVEDYDDDTVWSRYRATATDVTPLSSRMFHHGYMFGAVPFAFGVALLLYGIGRFLRKRLRVANGTAKAS
jgi:hypothetical protein